MWVQERTLLDSPTILGARLKLTKKIIGSRNACLLDLLLASVGKLLEALETIVLQSWPQKGTNIETSKSKQHTRVGA